MLPDLIQPADLNGFPGAPFSEQIARASAETVRTLCEWHIAPVLTETVEIETDGSGIILLPSLKIVTVDRVTDEYGIELTGWRVNRNRGVLRRASWPTNVTVEFTHGYDACPPALHAVIADQAARIHAGIVAQENVGARSVSLRATSYPFLDAILARYQLPKRP